MRVKCFSPKISNEIKTHKYKKLINKKRESNPCDLDVVVDIEVGSDRRESSADDVRLISLLPVHVHRILLAVHRHCPNSHLYSV